MAFNDAIKDISYGGIAGSLAKVIEFPFDTIKVRLQSLPNFQHESTWTTIKYTWNKEGLVNGFYKGLKAPMMGAFMESAVLFLSYNSSTNCLSNLTNSSKDLLWIQSLSGGFAGFFASFVLTPVELIKCNLQVSNLNTNHKTYNYSSMIKQVLRNDGITGLWKGLSSTIIRESGGTAIWFSTYEVSVKYLNQMNPNFESFNLLSSGALSGITFNLSMHPIDTIKSNIQTFDMLNQNLKVKPDFVQTTRKLVQTGGIKSLYHGLGITLIRAIPANAMIFYLYDFLKRNF